MLQNPLRGSYDSEINSQDRDISRQLCGCLERYVVFLSMLRNARDGRDVLGIF